MMSHHEILERVERVNDLLYPKSDTEKAIQCREKRMAAKRKPRLTRYNLRDYITLAMVNGMDEAAIIEEAAKNSSIRPETVKNYIHLCRKEMV